MHASQFFNFFISLLKKNCVRVLFRRTLYEESHLHRQIIGKDPARDVLGDVHEGGNTLMAGDFEYRCSDRQMQRHRGGFPRFFLHCAALRFDTAYLKVRPCRVPLLVSAALFRPHRGWDPDLGQAGLTNGTTHFMQKAGQKGTKQAFLNMTYHSTMLQELEPSRVG